MAWAGLAGAPVGDSSLEESSKRIQAPQRTLFLAKTMEDASMALEDVGDREPETSGDCGEQHVCSQWAGGGIFDLQRGQGSWLQA